jgi:beta-lactamase regulating signal transducer with metallopeptidase domain
VSSEAALAFAGLCFTYLLRSTAGYLLLWLLCRLIRDARLRFWLCGLFFAAMVAGWLGLLWLPTNSAVSASDGVALPSVSGLRWWWTVNSALASRLGMVLSSAPWGYAAILSLVFLQFLNRFRQLRFLLRSSQPPTEALVSLFESIRSGTGAPRCELRLVPGLRSPAATAWWNPKILLPSELLPRLEPQQLVDVLRHELMHVRRRDYLWDRLATLGCYLIFFHPAAWLVRRRLRWERELACDAGAVEGSRKQRLEYATCLTTLASWRFLEEEMAGPVDFLSSTPSLLAARVRALVLRQTQPYTRYQRAAVGLSVTAILFFAVLAAPEITVTPSSSAPRKVTIQGLSVGHQTIVRSDRTEASKRHKHLTHVTPSTLDSQFTPHSLESPISAPAHLMPQVPQSQPGPARARSRWSAIPRLGAWAIRSVRFGVTKIGSSIGDREHKNEPLG